MPPLKCPSLGETLHPGREKGRLCPHFARAAFRRLKCQRAQLCIPTQGTHSWRHQRLKLAEESPCVFSKLWSWHGVSSSPPTPAVSRHSCLDSARLSSVTSILVALVLTLAGTTHFHLPSSLYNYAPPCFHMRCWLCLTYHFLQVGPISSSRLRAQFCAKNVGFRDSRTCLN